MKLAPALEDGDLFATKPTVLAEFSQRFQFSNQLMIICFATQGSVREVRLSLRAAEALYGSQSWPKHRRGDRR
jgi:hypothetical protein